MVAFVGKDWTKGRKYNAKSLRARGGTPLVSIFFSKKIIA